MGPRIPLKHMKLNLMASKTYILTYYMTVYTTNTIKCELPVNQWPPFWKTSKWRQKGPRRPLKPMKFNPVASKTYILTYYTTLYHRHHQMRTSHKSMAAILKNIEMAAIRASETSETYEIESGGLKNIYFDIPHDFIPQTSSNANFP